MGCKGGCSKHHQLPYGLHKGGGAPRFFGMAKTQHEAQQKNNNGTTPRGARLLAFRCDSPPQ